MHSPLFRISSPIFETFLRLRGKFSNLTFFRKFSRFSSAKISDDLFLVIDYKSLISHLFSLFHYISPYFAKIIISPYFYKFSPLFSANLRVFYILYVYFVSPLL